MHECPESYFTARSRWLIFLFRQTHNIVPGWSVPTIQRLEWPHAARMQDEYLLIVQAFDIVHLELSAIFAEKSKEKPGKPTGVGVGADPPPAKGMENHPFYKVTRPLPELGSKN